MEGQVYEKCWTLGWGAIGSFLCGIRHDAEKFGCEYTDDSMEQKFNAQHTVKITVKGGDMEKFMKAMEWRHELYDEKVKP